MVENTVANQPNAQGTPHLPLVWPISVARSIKKLLGDSNGMIISVHFLCFWGSVLWINLFAQHEWSVWRSAWQELWPGMNGITLLLPLVLLLLGVLLWQTFAGVYWGGGICLIYIILQIKASLPPIECKEGPCDVTGWSTIGAHIATNWSLLIPATIHTLLIAVVPWFMLALIVELLWPTIVAWAMIGKRVIEGRDHYRHYAELRQLALLEQESVIEHQRVTYETNTAIRALQAESMRNEQTHQKRISMLEDRHRLSELHQIRGQLFANPTDIAPGAVQSTHPIQQQPGKEG
jgi:hypothetical protein